MNEKKDRRVERTRKAAQNALVALILERHYDDITVQDIIDRANIGRSTFYMHFRDKEDVLFSDWRGFLGFFMQHLDWKHIGTSRLVPIRELFHHLKDFHHFYRALERSRKSERLFKTGVMFLEEEFQKELVGRFSADQFTVPVPVLANYLAREIFGLMRWWLENNMPYSPEEMDEVFCKLVMPGIHGTIEVPG
jgi:AcrR family transcriptional regulator